MKLVPSYHGRLSEGMHRAEDPVLDFMLSDRSAESPPLQRGSMLKRLVDIVFSVFGIIVFFPFFPFIALIIKLDSKGPVFYLSDRVGRNLTRFKMWKFRTMIDTPIEVGRVSAHNSIQG